MALSQVRRGEHRGFCRNRLNGLPGAGLSAQRLGNAPAALEGVGDRTPTDHGGSNLGRRVGGRSALRGGCGYLSSKSSTAVIANACDWRFMVTVNLSKNPICPSTMLQGGEAHVVKKPTCASHSYDLSRSKPPASISISGGRKDDSDVSEANRTCIAADAGKDRPVRVGGYAYVLSDPRSHQNVVSS
jgi:hypothetical protein